MIDESIDQNTLFEDKDVKLTTSAIEIKCYYFPIGTRKVIPYGSVNTVEVRELGWAKGRLWGMDATQWGYWLAGDCSRMGRQQFIGIDIGSCVKPSFTTESTTEVFNIITTQVDRVRRMQMGGVPHSGDPNSSARQVAEFHSERNRGMESPILQN